MRTIPSEALLLLNANAPQRVHINTTFLDGSERVFTESDILANTCTIDRYVASGNVLELGCAAAGELSFTLRNANNELTPLRFEGAQMYVEIGLEGASTTYWIPMGYFTVDAPPRRLHSISISALDYMVRFDRPVDRSQFASEYTVAQLIDRLCVICSVTLDSGSAIASRPNADYRVAIPDDGNITCRTLLQWCCQLLGCCAYINEAGHLVIGWYTPTSYISVPSNRYSHTVAEQDVTITGISYTDKSGEDDIIRVAGTNEYAIDLTDNKLLTHDIDTALSAVFSAVGGFTYRPYDASVKPAPYLYPLDMGTVTLSGDDIVTDMLVTSDGDALITSDGDNLVTAAGATRSIIMTHVTFKLNGTTAIAGVGETEVEKGYATYGAMSAVESKILQVTKNVVKREIGEYDSALLDMNRLMANSMGLNLYAVAQPDGSKKYYFHNNDSLETASIIYTMNAAGFAWTNQWQGESTVWQYGLTAEGNAVLNMVNAYKISADVINGGTIHGVELKFGTEPNVVTLRDKDDHTGGLFTGDGSMQFRLKGNFEVYNRDSSHEYNSFSMYLEDGKPNVQLINKNRSGSTKNSILMLSEFGTYGTTDLYLYNYEGNSSRKANVISMIGKGVDDPDNKTTNSLRLRNYQNGQENSVLQLDSSMTYQTWNWHNFRLTGNDKQFRVNVIGNSATGAKESAGVSVAFRCAHFYVNGYDLVGSIAPTE